MFKCGVCSVTFRQMTTAEITSLASAAGLDSIEWGGDVHVRDAAEGAAALKLTRSAGLEVSSYGSYFRLAGDFAPVLDCARSIEAAAVRMWAGSKPSADVGANERASLVTAAREAVAAAAGMTAAFEWHGGTLTDTCGGAVNFAAETGAKLYWQPNQWLTFEENAAQLRRMLPYLANVHVFAWEGSAKLPLAAHEKRWREYLDIIAGGGKSPVLLMEFVPDNSPEAFRRDAAELLRWREFYK